jgi:2-phosphosulfolactate phosphatase
MVGAGAILAALEGHPAPEAQAAVAAFHAVAHADLVACASARELIDQGYEADVTIATLTNASNTVPILQDGAFMRCADRRLR